MQDYDLCNSTLITPPPFKVWDFSTHLKYKINSSGKWYLLLIHRRGRTHQHQKSKLSYTALLTCINPH